MEGKIKIYRLHQALISTINLQLSALIGELGYAYFGLKYKKVESGHFKKEKFLGNKTYKDTDLHVKLHFFLNLGPL